MKKSDYNYYKELVLREIPLEPCGKHHKDIAYNLHITPVETRDLIRILRSDGYPICSNSKDGYWMARNADEIQAVINMFNNYIGSMTNTLVALELTRIKRLKEEGRV